MLNEMNPKLRRVLGSAALAAALGLGTVGCSTPNDDYSEPPAIEQPAPETTEETPDNGGTENPDNPDNPENPDNPNPEQPGNDDNDSEEDNGGEEQVTFESLRDALFANPEEGNDIIAKLKTVSDGDIVSVTNKSIDDLGMDAVFVYNIQSKSFEEKTEGISGLMFMYQPSGSSLIGYVIPADMGSDFANAIGAFTN